MMWIHVLYPVQYHYSGHETQRTEIHCIAPMKLSWQLQYSTWTYAMNIGLNFEFAAIKLLESYGFRLVHSGRPGDRGRDFVGHWVLPDKAVRVIG